MEITFLPTNTSEIHLHVEQLLQNTGGKPQTSQKARNSPRTWVRQKKKEKQRQKNRDRTCTSGRELWRRKFPHTRKPLHWERWGVAGRKLWSHGGEHSNRGVEGKVERFPHRGLVPNSTHQPEKLSAHPLGWLWAGSWGSGFWSLISRRGLGWAVWTQPEGG